MSKETVKEDCGCIEKLRAALKTNLEAERVDFRLKTVINFKTGVMRPALPPLEFSYVKKVQGKRKLLTKVLRSYVPFNFCPFCGKAAR